MFVVLLHERWNMCVQFACFKIMQCATTAHGTVLKQANWKPSLFNATTRRRSSCKNIDSVITILNTVRGGRGDPESWIQDTCRDIE